jgi:hypothetical protein
MRRRIFALPLFGNISNKTILIEQKCVLTQKYSSTYEDKA